MHTAVKLGVYILSAVLAHWPSNWAVRKAIKRWRPEQEEPTDRMGAFIGTLERILIIMLVGLEAYTAVGFVVTMKSIARYDRVQKEKAFAEYFLAGTMLSMLIALILGLAVQRSFGKL
ncbi:hypothetical protein GWN60_28630 [candidate division KSB1 bacterium]|nr:hypothetical protein [candidate division KSB1 bacterium]